MTDPWVVATASPAAANQAMDLETFVTTEQFTRSELYANFIGRLGDDTARCMGVRLNNDWGSGFISVQRGLGQERFSAESLQELDRLFPHVRRMLAIRARMTAADHRSTLGKATLDALAQPVFLVNAGMRVKAANAASEILLNGSGPRLLAASL